MIHAGMNSKAATAATADVVAWLKEAYTFGITEELIGDLINEVQHQGATSSAMYPVALHLICLSQSSPPHVALSLLSHSGVIYADARDPEAVPCPEFLEDEFEIHAAIAARLLAPLLPVAEDFDGFKYGCAGLAGFSGHQEFGRFLVGLDFFDGKFFHNSQEEPIGDK